MAGWLPRVCVCCLAWSSEPSISLGDFCAGRLLIIETWKAQRREHSQAIDGKAVARGAESGASKTGKHWPRNWTTPALAQKRQTADVTPICCSLRSDDVFLTADPCPNAIRALCAQEPELEAAWAGGGVLRQRANHRLSHDCWPIPHREPWEPFRSSEPPEPFRLTRLPLADST